MDVRLLEGDCLALMREIPDASVDAVVTDPPAGIAFMGKEWDAFGSRPPKRSGYVAHNSTTMLANGRGLTIEASRKSRVGFIDFLTPRMAEAHRIARPGTYALVWALPRTSHWTATAVEDAGWTIRDRVTHLFGTGFPKAKSCLKPGAEDWWLAYKPGGKMAPLQIDACRIAAPGGLTSGGRNVGSSPNPMSRAAGMAENRDRSQEHPSGRWPANVVLDEDAAELLDAMSGPSVSRKGSPRSSASPGAGWGTTHTGAEYDDSGGASRFFYAAKASRDDRGEGNTHPTVKSEPLMRWLCRLITPPAGVIADPFMGSGSTGKAAVLEGFGFLGIERDPGYFAIARGRIGEARARTPLLAE